MHTTQQGVAHRRAEAACRCESLAPCAACTAARADTPARRILVDEAIAHLETLLAVRS